MECVGFTLGDHLFGANVTDVLEIDRLRPIIPLPNAPDYIQGVLTIRSSIVPVIDMYKRLDLPRIPSEATRSRLLILDIHGTVVSFPVDTVTGIDAITGMRPVAAEDLPSSSTGRFITGSCTLGGREMLVLNFDAILDAKSRSQLATVGQAA